MSQVASSSTTGCKIKNIMELGRDLLMSCCHYLPEKDIHRFTEVNKYFAKIGMDPMAMSHITLSELSGHLEQKIQSNRYRCIAGLLLRETPLPFPIHEQLSKLLRTLIIYRHNISDMSYGPDELFSKMCYHGFENLNKLYLRKMDPAIIFNKVNILNRHKLTELSIDICPIEKPIEIISFIYSCINLRKLRLVTSLQDTNDLISKMNDVDMRNSVDTNATWNNLECMDTDLNSAVAWKPLFYHLITYSNLHRLKIGHRKFEVAPIGIAIFDENDFGIKQVKQMLTHLRSFEIHIYSYQELASLQNLGDSITKLNIPFCCDEFQIHLKSLSRIDDDGETEQFLRDNLDSINIHKSLDIIMAYTIESELVIDTDNSMMIRALVSQFHNSHNKQIRGFTKVRFRITGYQRTDICDEYAANAESDAVSLANRLIDGIWLEYKLDHWMELCETDSAPSLSEYGIKELSLDIELYDYGKSIFTLQEDALMDVETAISDRIDHRMTDYHYPHYQYVDSCFEIIYMSNSV